MLKASVSVGGEDLAASLEVLQFVLHQLKDGVSLDRVPLLPCASGSMAEFSEDAPDVYLVQDAQLVLMQEARGVLGQHVHACAGQHSAALREQLRGLARSSRPYQLRLWESSAALVSRALAAIDAASLGGYIEEALRLSHAVLDNWALLGLAHAGEEWSWLQDTRCVESLGGGLHRPRDLLDPQSARLVKLFLSDTGPFPSQAFRKPSCFNLELRKELTRQELETVVQSLHSSSDSGVSTSLLAISTALSDYLSEVPNLADSAEPGALSFRTCCAESRWLQALQLPPGWPELIPWAADAGRFYVPSQLHMAEPCLVVGTVAPLTKGPHVLQTWLKKLGSQCMIPSMMLEALRCLQSVNGIAPE